jgi:hypothetical protein
MYSESWTDGKRDIESLCSEGQSLDDWGNCTGENLYLDILSALGKGLMGYRRGTGGVPGGVPCRIMGLDTDHSRRRPKLQQKTETPKIALKRTRKKPK